MKLISNHSIAINSYDHLQPLGAKNDNHSNPTFNRWFYSIANQLEKSSPYKILDLGCAGGAMVKNFIDDGHIGIGLEGCNYNRKHNRHEWGTIPDNLFNCDITKPFKLIENSRIVKFDLITLWEVLEHIENFKLDCLLNNILLHLDGLLVCTIAVTENPDIIYHRTEHGYNWWTERVNGAGLLHSSLTRFLTGEVCVRHKAGKCFTTKKYHDLCEQI